MRDWRGYQLLPSGNRVLPPLPELLDDIGGVAPAVGECPFVVECVAVRLYRRTGPPHPAPRLKPWSRPGRRGGGPGYGYGGGGNYYAVDKGGNTLSLFDVTNISIIPYGFNHINADFALDGLYRSAYRYSQRHPLIGVFHGTQNYFERQTRSLRKAYAHNSGQRPVLVRV